MVGASSLGASGRRSGGGVHVRCARAGGQRVAVGADRRFAGHVHRLRDVRRPSAAIASFEAAAGGGDNGTIAGEQTGGFRHATWDQIALNGSDPGSTTIESGHVIVARAQPAAAVGLELGPEIAVSGDGFALGDSSRSSRRSAAPNVWGPFNTDTAEFDVVVPAGPGEHADAGADPRTRDRLPECHRDRPRSRSVLQRRYRTAAAPVSAPVGHDARSPACCSPTRS